ncbi:MAG: hypothetical protein KDB14_04305 [Planctomycetales bacterium]|nr:hypothetical protein [Planctomycetales bacterium]
MASDSLFQRPSGEPPRAAHWTAHGAARIVVLLALASAWGCRSPQLDARRAIEAAGGSVELEEGRIVRVDVTGLPHVAQLLASLPALDSVTELRAALTDLDDRALESVRSWPLRRLDVRGTDVTDAALPLINGFRELTWLSLADTRVSSLAALTDLNQLQELALPPAADDNELAWVARWPKLQILFASGTKVTGAGLRQLTPANVPLLSTLYLAELSLDDRDLLQLPVHDKLQRLVLRDNQLGDGAAAHVSRFRGLDYLDFSRTGLTDEGLRTLAELPLLYILDLDGSQVTSDGILEIREARPSLRVTHAMLAPPTT